jgi:hypothetical protein
MNAVGSGNELEGRRAFRAEAAFRDGGVRVALDIRDPVVLDVHELCTPDRAVRTDGLHDPVGFARSGGQGRASIGKGGFSEAGEISIPGLAKNGPFENGIERLEKTHELPSSAGGTLAEEPSG